MRALLTHFHLNTIGSAGVLRICALVDHPAHHTAPVHLPSLPQRCDTRRDLEDHLQGTPGVSWIVNIYRHIYPGTHTYVLAIAGRGSYGNYENAPKIKKKKPKM